MTRRKWRRVFLSAVPAALLCLAGAAFATRANGALGRASASDLGRVCAGFEVNQGQASSPALFFAHAPGFSVTLEQNGMGLEFAGADRGLASRLALRFGGANTTVRLAGLETLPTRSHYYIGRDPGNWRLDVPHYGKVRYAALYPGIDALVHFEGCELTYDFVLAPGADPSAIAVDFEGTRQLRIDERGDLLLAVGDGELRQRRPAIYQENAKGRRQVEGHYVIRKPGRVGVELDDYDRREPLVIDPTLVSSTYLGDVRYDAGHAIALDGVGNIYVAGGRQQADNVDTDVFVAKFDRSGRTLLWRTHLGGIFNEEAKGLAVDAAGRAHVVGFTASSPSNPPGRPEFPRTANALQAAFGGGSTDAFVSVLSPAGTLSYSSFLGGSADDEAEGIALDFARNAIVTGSTRSTDFPLAQPFQGALAGGSDGFVVKLDAEKSGLLYSTFLGGSGDDRASSVALDRAGNAYLTGVTASPDFPIADPVQAAYGGGVSDAFVTKLPPDGAFLVYSTYLGGSGADEARDVAVDGSRSAYVTGGTDSPDFPTLNALQSSLQVPSQSDAFLSKLAPWGFGFVYSTYLGGKGGTSVAVDAAQCAYVTGGDVLAAKLSRAGSRLDYVFWGIAGSAITLGPSHDAFVTGKTLSNLLPTRGAFQPRKGGMFSSRGREDAFVTRVSAAAAPAPSVQESDPAVSYSGAWTVSGLPAHSGGSAVRSMEPGARANFTFTGTGVQLIGYRDESAGSARIVTDGVLVWGAADTYASPTEARAQILSITGLPAGTHTLSVEVLGLKNPRAQGTWVWVDAFTVLP